MRDINELAIYRFEMMERGYMNKKELAQFLDCGKDRARKTFNAIMLDVKREGLESIDDNIVLTKRAIQYLGLTQKQILDSYERAIKKG